MISKFFEHDMMAPRKPTKKKYTVNTRWYMDITSTPVHPESKHLPCIPSSLRWSKPKQD